jgi:hypothetical protein
MELVLHPAHFSRKMLAHLQACQSLASNSALLFSNLSDPVSYLANQRFVFISLRKRSPERKWECLPQPWDLTMFILEKRKDLLVGNGCSEKLTNGGGRFGARESRGPTVGRAAPGCRLRENDSAASAMI